MENGHPSPPPPSTQFSPCQVVIFFRHDTLPPPPRLPTLPCGLRSNSGASADLISELDPDLPTQPQPDPNESMSGSVCLCIAAPCCPNDAWHSAVRQISREGSDATALLLDDIMSGLPSGTPANAVLTV